MIEQKIEQDLKSALLSGDSERVTTLRTLKGAILNVKVDSGKRESGLTDEEVISILSKEAKKRQESADLYKQGGSEERANKELAEKLLIETYLPKQLSEEEIRTIVDEVMQPLGAVDKSAMGTIIKEVKSRTVGIADGALIAKIVKEKLQ